MKANRFVQTESADGVLIAQVLAHTLSEYESGIVLADIDRAVAGAGWKVIVDCSKVTMLASAGIGMFVTLNRRCAENEGGLAVCGFSDDILGVLKLTRMDHMFTIADTRDQATAALG